MPRTASGPLVWLVCAILAGLAAPVRAGPEETVAAVVGLKAEVPANARTAATLGRERSGSGIVIDEGGLVLTIGYLILEASAVDLYPADGKRVPAEIVGYDHDTGLALVRATVPLGIEPIRLGRSGEIAVGEPLLVLSRDERLGGRETKLASRREFAGYWEYLLDNAIFTVPAFPMWGGSALIGAEGELLGVGSLLVQEALGPGAPAFPGNMYVPINRLKPIFQELVSTGRLSTPPRPWLGLYTLEHVGHLVVGGIFDGGPADRAGLQRGDILHALNDDVLDDIADFYRKLWGSGPAGTAVKLRMERDGDAFEVTVRTGDRAAYHKFGSD